MYFLLIRPQRRRTREAQELNRALSVGDEVQTASGIVGFITGFDKEDQAGDVAWIDIADNVEIRVMRSAISRRGGASVTLEPQGDYDADALTVAVEIIRQRVDSIGVAEPEIIRQGDTVVINLPGVKDQKRALDIVGRTGEVLMRPVLQSGVPNDNASTTTVAGATTTSLVESPTAESPTTLAGDTATTIAPTTVPAPGSGLRFASSATSTTIPATTVPETTVPESTVPETTQPATAVATAEGATTTSSPELLLATGDTTTTTVAAAAPDISLTNEPDKIAFLTGRDGLVY